ncbi:MAG: hypothetical protein Q9212_005728 [Teloschistes hypoglaucus]
MMLLYSSTYLTANIVDTISSTAQNQPASTTTSGIAKFGAVSSVNMSLALFKDSQFTKMFGTVAPRPLPPASYALLALRDSMTIFASFNLPSKFAPTLPESIENHCSRLSVAQFATPAFIQIFNSPLHLLGLDLYNRNQPTAVRDRMSKPFHTTIPYNYTSERVVQVPSAVSSMADQSNIGRMPEASDLDRMAAMVKEVTQNLETFRSYASLGPQQISEQTLKTITEGTVADLESELRKMMDKVQRQGAKMKEDRDELTKGQTELNLTIAESELQAKEEDIVKMENKTEEKEKAVLKSEEENMKERARLDAEKIAAVKDREEAKESRQRYEDFTKEAKKDRVNFVQMTQELHTRADGLQDREDKLREKEEKLRELLKNNQDEWESLVKIKWEVQQKENQLASLDERMREVGKADAKVKEDQDRGRRTDDWLEERQRLTSVEKRSRLKKSHSEERREKLDKAKDETMARKLEEIGNVQLESMKQLSEQKLNGFSEKLNDWRSKEAESRQKSFDDIINQLKTSDKHLETKLQNLDTSQQKSSKTSPAT